MRPIKRLAVVVTLVALCGCRSGFSRDDAARICATLQACTPDDFWLFGDTMTECTTFNGVIPLPGSMETSPAITHGLERPLRDIYACLLAARGDCEKARRCWAQSGDPGTCAPVSGFQSGTCAGTVLSGCNAAGQRFATDCGKYGEVCGTAPYVFGSFGSCGAAACPSAGAHLVCRGSAAEVCQGSLLALVECGHLGLRCELPTDGGDAACVGGASCDPASDPAKCEGSVMVRCTAEGQHVRIDCAASPRRRQCRAGQCVETGNECTDRRASCVGGILSFCQDGSRQHFDCAAEGFGACAAGRCTAR